MRGIFFKIIASALMAGVCWFAVLWFVRAPIASEFWLRELLIVKNAQIRKLPAPRVIVVGGSSVWFDVDATMMEKELGRPCYNYGLHAGLRPEWVLEEVRKIVKPGDLLVLMPEDAFFEKTTDWDTWAFRTAIAWNPDWIDHLSFGEKVGTILKAGSLAEALEIAQAKALCAVRSPPMQKRQKSLVGRDEVLKRFKEEQGSYEGIVYSQSNIDDRGDILHNDGCRYHGSGFESAAHGDGSISPYMKRLLAGFLEEMKARHVKVVVAHTPSHLSDPENPRWDEIDKNLREELRALGVELIDRRRELVFSRDCFYDTPWHLNMDAKKQRTNLLIQALRTNQLVDPRGRP